MRHTFKRFLADQVVHRPFEALDGDGRASYGVGVVHAARVEGVRRMVYDKTGRQLEASTRVICDDTLTALHPRDQIELPDGTAPRIVQVDRHTDTDGSFSHFEALLAGGPA